MGIWSSISIPPAPILNGVATDAIARQISVAARGRVVPLTYGEDRIAGLLLNVLPHGTDGTLLLVQVLWGHMLDSIGDVLLNDQALPAGSSVLHYRGDQIGADPEMFFAMQKQGIAYTVSLAGFAYSLVRMPVKAFTGQLNFTGRVRGRRLYDPRRDSTNGGAGTHRLADPSTWEWSDCPALAKGDWTVNKVYGAGRPVVWSSVAAVANANDALVGTGTQEKRRTMGLTLNSAAEVPQLAEALRAYAGCWTIPTQNGVQLIADADAAPVDDIEHEAGDILAMSPITIRDVSTAPTSVEVIFTDTSKVPYRDGSAIAELPGAGSTRPLRLSQVRLPGVQRYSQAMREAIERLNKLTLADLSTTVDVADEGIQYQRADIVRLSHPVGLALKPMRVLSSVMTRPGRWRLQLQEHDPASYSSVVQTQPSVADTSFNNPAGPPAQVVGLSATVSTLQVTLSRTPTSDVAFSYTAWEYSTNGGGTYSPIPAVPINNGRSGSTWQTSIQGALRIRARDVDRDGVAGPYSLAYDFTVGPEILPPASASATLGIKINVGDFAGTTNYSEAYIHGRDSSGAAADVNGTIQINGAPVSVPKGQLVTGLGPVSAFIVWDSAGSTFSTTIPDLRPWVMARKVNGQWQYDNNNAWVNFTPGPTHFVIGLIQTGGPDTGSPGTPPGILSATMLSAAWVPDVIAALGTTADWTGVVNRPSTYRVAARGLNGGGATPIEAGLYDSDTGTLLEGWGSMYVVVKIHRSTKVKTTLGAFNPLSGAGGALAQCNAMAAALNSIDVFHICVVFSYDEPATNRLLGDLPAAMYRCGASRAVWGSAAFQYRGAYILVGIGGCGEGNGAENYAGAVSHDPNSWCDTTFQITATGALVVSGAARGATTLIDYGYIGSLDATTNRFFEQETDPTVSPGGVLDGSFWRVPSTSKWYQRIAGTWRATVAPGTIGTPELGNESATALRGATNTSGVDLLSNPATGPFTLNQFTYTAVADCTVVIRLNGVIEHFSGYGVPGSGASAAFHAFGQITTSASYSPDGLPGSGDTQLSYNASSVDPFVSIPIYLEKRYAMSAGQTLTFFARAHAPSMTNVPGAPGTITGAICRVVAGNQLLVEVIKK